MLHLGKLLALSTNIRLSCKGLLETNTLAYSKNSQIPDEKKFYKICTCPDRPLGSLEVLHDFEGELGADAVADDDEVALLGDELFDEILRSISAFN